MIERLRAEDVVLLSLVAEMDAKIAGHILFSRMWIDTESGPLEAVALAPMAVLPSHQRSGIGAALVQRGLEMLRERGERIVLVLGHASYYPRFGFSVEKARRLETPFPPEAFMAIELATGALDRVRGRVCYAAAFGL